MAAEKKYEGIIPAFYACYDDKGAVSAERSSRLAEYYHSIGIRGLYVTGSSGECVFQSAEERKRTLEAVMEAVGGRMTIIAHVAAPATKDSIALAQHAERLGVDAIAMVPGFFYGLNVDMVRKYWCDVLDATDSVPMFIYNIPPLTNGFNTPTSLFEEMLATGRVAGVKNSSGSVQDILRYRMAGGPDIAILSGADEQYLAGRMMGASGGIGGTYGFMPELFLRLEELITEGRISEAKRLQQQITGIIYDTVATGSLYAAAKEFLRRRGINCGSVRPPFLPIREDQQPQIDWIDQKIHAIMES